MTFVSATHREYIRAELACELFVANTFRLSFLCSILMTSSNLVTMWEGGGGCCNPELSGMYPSDACTPSVTFI